MSEHSLQSAPEDQVRGAPSRLATPAEPLPQLYQDRSFWGMTATQFLGAFNDNLFKQLMLLLAVPVGAAAASMQDQQGVATVVFSLPFVLFSGYAGFLSDRYSKRRIIISAKLAEILVMLLGMLGFAMYGFSGYSGLLLVMFLMGTQSAFFGPGKYGILPEMLRAPDLPRANGIILMTTFLAIIFGTASAGLLGDWFVVEDSLGRQNAQRLWIGSTFCVTIAVLGTLTSLLIRRVRPAQRDLQFQPSALTIPPETRRMLGSDRPLLLALLASCMFWLVSGIAIQAVNALGLVQLQLDKFWTSVMTAMIGLGIACGAVIAGRLCHGRADFRIVRVGVWGIFVCLLVLSISRADGVHLLDFRGSISAPPQLQKLLLVCAAMGPVLILLGMSAGFFAIPVQVFIQARPSREQKGRMIAVMNQANFIAILLSGVVYTVFVRICEALHWPRSPIFAMMAVLILPVAVFYRPKLDPPH